MTDLTVPRIAVPALAALTFFVSLQEPVAATPESCTEESFILEQIDCFVTAAEAAGDPTVCDVATDDTVQFQCLALYAERRLDPAPCARVRAGTDARETQALRGACVAGVAVKRGDPALCENTGTQALADACYMMIVTEAGGDPVLCDRIENQPLRSACRTPDAGNR